MNNTMNSRIAEALADEKFLSKFQEITSKDEIMNLFSVEKGIEINDSIAQEILLGLNELKNSGELSEADLENAAGGMCIWIAPIRNIFTKVFSTHVDFAGAFDFNIRNTHESRRGF